MLKWEKEKNKQKKMILEPALKVSGGQWKGALEDSEELELFRQRGLWDCHEDTPYSKRG